jgi:N-acetyl-gamma-glutamyl-phosphate reductase
MKPVVFIDGEQGTTGLQIMSRLEPRGDLELITLPSTERKNTRQRMAALNQCDIAILCLPDAAAREAASFVRNPMVRLIDASSAHRTDPLWVYGFPEMAQDQPGKIAEAKRISNPGCYPTGAIALIKPLIDAGLLPANYPLAIHAVSGYSGRGRIGVEEHEGSNGASALAFQVYGLTLQHKHVPEIQQHAGLSQRPFFTPSYGSFRQGIALTIPIQLRLLEPGLSSKGLRDCLAAHYSDARQIKVLTEEESAMIGQLDPQLLNGTNHMNLAVFGNDREGQVLLTAVFDNLGKGASGAAVQNLDLMLQSSGISNG